MTILIKTDLSMLRRTSFFAILLLCFAMLGVSACKERKPTAELRDDKNLRLERCVALRGNGTHIVAHATGLARLTSQWGVIDAIAGGSSATISTFIYESMLMNPGVIGLDAMSRKDAVALLLKSLVGFAEQLSTEPEWQSLQSAVVIGQKLRSHKVFEVPTSDLTKLAASLKTALSSDDIKALVNPDILRMLQPTADVEYGGFKNRVLEVRKAALSLVDLDATDPDVFFRPGLINFPYFVGMIGRVGDFYAGREVDQLRFKDFLNDCSPGTSDLLWKEIAIRKARVGTCGEAFTSLVRTWRSVYQKRESSRLKEPPGLGMASIMITSVVQDADGVNALKSYDQQYQSGLDRKLALNFETVKFGYWTSSGLPSNLIHSWRNSSTDAKAQKAVGLGYPKTWREILEKSPREPSLGKVVEFGPDESAAGAVSLGGWADLHPVQVLRFAGCKEVIYLTRRTGETSFITKGRPFEGRPRFGLAELLGMPEADYDRIYSLDAESSSYSSALRDANGVWCTDWNKFAAQEQSDIALDSWQAPLVTRGSHFSTWPSVDKSGRKIIGCN